jgi:hypothetical protein
MKNSPSSGAKPFTRSAAQLDISGPVTTEQLDQTLRQVAGSHLIALPQKRSNAGTTGPRQLSPAQLLATLNLELPLVIDPDRCGVEHGFGADRVISFLRKTGFPEHVLAAMNKERNLTLAREEAKAKKQEFDFKNWVFDTSSKLDERNISSGLTPQGLSYSEVIRRFVFGLTEYKKESTYTIRCAMDIKIEKALYDSICNSDPSVSTDKLLVSVKKEIGIKNAASYLSEACKNISSTESKAALHEAYRLCTLDPNAAKFFKSAFGTENYGFAFSMLLCRNNAKRQNILDDFQKRSFYSNYLISSETPFRLMKNYHQEVEQRCANTPRLSLPADAVAEALKIPPEDAAMMLLYFARKDTSVFLERETQHANATGACLSKTKAAEMNQLFDKLMHDLIHPPVPQTEVLRHAAEHIFYRTICSSEPHGVRSMVMVSITSKNVALFRANMAKACELAKNKMAAKQHAEAHDLDGKDFYEQAVSALERGVGLFSDNDHYTPREMDLFATSILILDHSAGGALPETVPEPEELSNILVNDVTIGIKRKYRAQNKNLPEGFSRDGFFDQVKYIPKFLTHPEHNMFF